MGRSLALAASFAAAAFAVMSLGACELAPGPDPDGDRGTPSSRRKVESSSNEPAPMGGGSAPGASSSGSSARPSGSITDVRCTADAQCGAGVCAASGPAKGTCITQRSCNGASGADHRCGRTQTDDCCAASAVPAGSFRNVSADGPQAATLSGYRLDDFEITVGRLRAFVDAMDGRLREHAPAAGAGAHPKIANSGWRSSFDVRLPDSRAALDDRLTDSCAVAGGTTDYGSSTWTRSPGPNEDKPVTCLDWYTAFAFCAWDGGRLPTDAEWSMAAAGGSEQRRYAWGNDAPLYETHKDVVVSMLPSADGSMMFTEGSPYRDGDDGPFQIARVGKHSERGRWGQADLTGNVLEWVLDRATFIEGTCRDCADVTWPNPPQVAGLQPPDWAKNVGDEFSSERAALDGERFVRGSSFQGDEGGHPMVNGENRHYYPVWRTYGAIGARCAR